MQRATLAAPTPQIGGVGMHSGNASWVKLSPCKPDKIGSGIRYVDSNSRADVLVTPFAVSSTTRCTSIQVGGSSLSTIEHLMSALSGMGVTDAVVTFSGDEVPILDGSAAPFVEAIKVAGIKPLNAQMDVFEPKSPISISHGQSHLAIFPADRFSVSVTITYDDRSDLAFQAAYFDGTDYDCEIAPARTYGFLSEFEELRARGLAGAASLENCIALTDSGAADPRTPLRFENELARHKLLDVIGDLALTGLDLRGHVVAHRPSHTVNCTLARQIAQEFALQRR